MACSRMPSLRSVSQHTFPTFTKVLLDELVPQMKRLCPRLGC